MMTRKDRRSVSVLNVNIRLSLVSTVPFGLILVAYCRYERRIQVMEEVGHSGSKPSGIRL